MARFVRPLLVVAAIAGLLALVWSTGLADHVRDEDRLRSTIEDAGVLGPVLFVGLMVVLVPLNVPGLVFVIPATTLFGTVGGVTLSLVGGFLASAVGIVAARRIGQETFARRIPARVRRLEQRVSARGFWTVAATRACTFLMQPVDWLLGLSSLPMRTVLAGTFVGLIPPTLVVTLAGGSLFGSVL
jgi:uncharacterized membrane protein YdjX (TVP38/TMEM64 family)